MNKLLIILSLSAFVFNANSQSNTPCNFLGAPILTVNAACLPTNGTTNGATYQSNQNNGGTPPCANPGSPDVWYRFIAPVGGDVAIQTASGTMIDGAMALYSGGCPNNFNLVECDDDSGPGLMPQITATGLTPGAFYYIRIWQFGSGTGTFSICLTIPTPLQPNTDCNNPDPICSGTPINFTANTGAPSAQQTNPGNDYGCLATTPNPSWYYLEIANGGNLVIDVSAGSDVDFAIWGPYPNLTAGVANCDNHGVPQDCSYSTSEIEQVNLNNVNSSEVYVLLVTNFANTVQNITVNNNGGSATTNCGIVPLPVELVSFEGSANNGVAELTWLTASERDNDFFAIERRTESGIWEAISIVQGAGTTTQSTAYSYEDKNSRNGVNYYRLKQVDFNGKTTNSDVISVDSQTEQRIELFPNPADKVAQVRGVRMKDIQTIEAVSLQGMVTAIESYEKDGAIEVDVSQLKSGLYIIRCAKTDGTYLMSRITII